MSQYEFVGYPTIDRSVHRESLSVPAPEHGEIVRLIQQLKRGSTLNCRLARPTDGLHHLDIRVLPQTLAALAARQRS